MNVSPLHNRELENLIVAMLAGLPEKPIKDLKKLLEIYAELLSINHSKAKDEQVLHLLDIWKGVANLKKAVANIHLRRLLQLLNLLLCATVLAWLCHRSGKVVPT